MKASTRAKPALKNRPLPEIAGIGQFRSGVRNLGSDKTHLKNFGR